METLTDLTCEGFADALAAKQSVPGGGGAAAYAGALGVALCSMVGNFTTGKKKYALYEEDVQRMLADGEEIRRKLVQLVDDDARAFEPLSRAYGIPKEDPTRAQVMEEATKGAIVAPVQMMEECCKAVELLEEMLEKGSVMLLSDVGCGALLCRAALEAASLNVFVNTKGLADRAYAAEVDGACDAMLKEYIPRAEAVAAQVMTKVKGE